MKTYKIELELDVDQVWIDDGLTAETLERRIKEELPANLCAYAYSHEIIVRKIKVNLKK